MRLIISRYLGLSAVLCGCVGSVACDSEPLRDDSSSAAPSGSSEDPSPAAAAAQEASNEQGNGIAPLPLSPEQKAEFDRENAKIRCNEASSPTELSGRWDNTSETSTSEVTAILHNHTAVAITAEPVIMAANSALGEARERRLDPVMVAPGSEVSVAVKVADFPMQSLGDDSTSVSIGLRWRRADSPAEMVSPQAISQPLFAIHDDDSFRTAVLRVRNSEIARQQARVVAKRPFGYRVLRALEPSGSREFKRIDRVDAPTVAVTSVLPSNNGIEVQP